jgi:Domain of unknown function (DUF1963)
MLQNNSEKLHAELDFNEVRRVFADFREAGDLAGELITSPFDLYAVETLRDSLGLRHGNAVPVDVFVFGKGEPNRRDCTKVGGVPYWPSDTPWPTKLDGSPFRFLAKFNFADSKDIIDDLEADVLLLLVDDTEEWLWEPDRIRFEWLPSSMSSLMAFDRQQTSELSVSEGVFYGAIHRTEDYPLSVAAAQTTTVSAGYNLSILNGTKIGGVPCFIQDGADNTGRFLCQLGSIQAAYAAPFPWVNQREPLSFAHDDTGIYGGRNSIVFGDMGNIYIFIDEWGQLRSGFECY